MFISVILGASQTLIMKSFAISKSVTNEHSFYLLTNVVILIWGIILLLSSVISEHGNFRNGLSFFKPKRVLSSVGNVVSSNINSLVTMPIMAAVNISLFSPLSSAYGIVANVLVSLLFKEKLGIYSYIGTAIAILAIFI